MKEQQFRQQQAKQQQILNRSWLALGLSVILAGYVVLWLTANKQVMARQMTVKKGIASTLPEFSCWGFLRLRIGKTRHLCILRPALNGRCFPHRVTRSSSISCDDPLR